MIEFPHLMQVLMGIVALASLVTSIVMTRGKAASDRVAKLETSIDGLESRVTTVEGEVRHMPDRETSHRLELAIERLEGRMEVMDERLKPVAAMANRVHERMFEELNGR
ncbi:DUF2730 family protein [Azorhizobium caulinodans]|uniref:DUF2730 family protein n=1 Tax=Azorhizobium caulinodans TaxID=7 RepID=UPI002FBD541B